jgi:hypothetical protein
MSVTFTPGPAQRAGLVAVIVAGPLSIAILRAILPYYSSDDAATIAAKVAAHETAQSAQLWLTLIAMITLVPGVIAVGLLAARQARTLGTWGLCLATAGFSLLWATTALDFAASAVAQAGIGPEASGKVLEELNALPTQVVAITVFVLGHILGMILIGAALLRGRAIPPWAAWALIISQPLHLVFAVIVPVPALHAGSWILTTSGFAAAAAAIVRTAPDPVPA